MKRDHLAVAETEKKWLLTGLAKKKDDGKTCC